MKRIALLTLFSLAVFSYACNPNKNKGDKDIKHSEYNENNKTRDMEQEKLTQDLENPQGEKRLSPLHKTDGMVGDIKINVQYGSPAVKGRKIYGGLVPYGKVWRTGANEATTVEFSKDVLIKGNKLPAGKYALFTIPYEDRPWVVIFNKVWDQWGAFDYNKDEDALRVDIKPQMKDESQERLKIEVTDKGVQMTWEKLVLTIPVNKAE